MNDEQRRLLMRGMGAFAAVLVVLLAAGTFADLQVAQAVYAPDSPLVVFVSTLGLFPMAYPACLLLGVLVQRSLASRKSRVLGIAGAVLCALLAVLFGALIARAPSRRTPQSSTSSMGRATRYSVPACTLRPHDRGNIINVILKY